MLVLEIIILIFNYFSEYLKSLTDILENTVSILESIDFIFSIVKKNEKSKKKVKKKHKNK